eukprot:s370_g7.t1
MAHFLPRPASREDEAAGYPSRQRGPPLAPSPNLISQRASQSGSNRKQLQQAKTIDDEDPHDALMSASSTQSAGGRSSEEVLEALRQVAQLEGDVVPTPAEALKLYFTAQRLSQEERWGQISVVQNGSTWAIRGAHFAEDFEDFRFEVVIPLLSHESITLESHEALCQELGHEGLFYALLDADGSVVLYELRKPKLWSPIDRRRCDEPFLQPEMLAEMARSSQDDEAKEGGKKSKRKRAKKD